MAITIKHAKTDTIADWTQADLDAQIALGNFPPGTLLADIVLPSDWNNDHTISGTIAIANGGTGQTTANAAINALLPSQTSQSGKVLSTDGTNTSWIAAGGTGTVTSVALTAPSIFSVSGSPITAAGTLALTYSGTALPVANGGSGATTLTGYVKGNGTSAFTASATVPSTDITGLGTMSTQNANSVTITGGTVNGTTIGATTATTGAFTTLTASTSLTTPTVQATNSGGLSLKNSAGTTQMSMGAGGGDNISLNVSTNLNGSNAQIDISPTGTGHVHINPTGLGSIQVNPTSVGTIDNMTIGATTPKNGSFVDFSVTGTTSFDGSQGTAGQVLTSAGTGATPTWTTPAAGTVTSVTGTAPVVSSGGTTPAISMAAASSTVNGYLTSTDWTTFNSKGSGTVTSVSATSPVTSTGGTTPTIAMPAATTSVSGYLTSTDWTTFNNKGSGTVTSVAVTAPSIFSVAGSPITSSGTIALTYSGTALPVANGGTGTSTAFTTGSVVFAGASGTYTEDNANFFWDNTNNRLGIGTASPTAPLSIYGASTATLQVTTDGTIANIISARYSTNSGSAAISIRKGRGTFASPTAVASADQLGQLIFQGYGGTNNRNLANILGLVETYTSDTDISSALTFSTSPSGSTTATEKMRISAAGNVGIGTSNPQLRLHTLGPQGAVASFPTLSGNSTAVFENNLNTKIALVNAGGVGVTSSIQSYASGDTFPRVELLFASNTSSLNIHTGSGSVIATEKMRIHSTGGVSIGNTTDPGATNLSVTGSITGGALSATSNAVTSVLAATSGLTANTTVTNTATFTTAGLTLATQTAAAGSVWRITAYGQFTAASSATARTAEIACFWGTTQLTAITPTVLAAAAQTTQWQVEFELSATSTTAIWTTGSLINRVASATLLAVDNATPASTTVTSGAQTLDLRVRVSTAVAAESWIIQQITMERIK